ncbi:WD40 repeat-like protein [Paraphysoderma sedebokerense]|nr:WD40 repeat-like protein [Paraphysoderma sedebokerense]
MYLRFKTEGYHGYSVEYSPFFENKLAVASSSNYGIVGNGRLWLLSLVPGRGIVADKVFDTQDGLFDSSWSEMNENQIVTASGDGSIKLWDVTLKDFPIQNWHEHTREVFSVDWNLVKKDCFVSGSWDQTIKLWHPERPQSISTLLGHSHCVYSAIWSPHHPNMIASSSGDQSIKIWDTSAPPQSACINSIHAHQHEILSIDWNKYADKVLVTGSADHSVRVWDLRKSNSPVSTISGHTFAVRRVKWCPWRENVLASVGYDMTARVASVEGRTLHVNDAHTEFVLGLDWNLYIEGQMATCSWDEHVQVFTVPVQ